MIAICKYGSYPIIGDELWQVTENDRLESTRRC